MHNDEMHFMKRCGNISSMKIYQLYLRNQINNVIVYLRCWALVNDKGVRTRVRACSRFIHSIARPHLYRKKKSSALCTHDNNVVMQNVQQFVYTALTNPMDVTFSMRLKMLFHFALLSFYQHVLCIQNNIFIGSIHNPPVSCFVIREERHGVHVCANVFFWCTVSRQLAISVLQLPCKCIHHQIFLPELNVIVPSIECSHMYVLLYAHIFMHLNV